MPGAEIKSSLAQFAAFARALKGDEKSEAQIFLDHFTDVTGAQVLAASAQAKKCYTGQNPVSAGFFLTLNLALAAKEKSGEAITPPGLPLPDAERAAFTTTDCIRA